MILELTEQQRQIVADRAGSPVEFIDPDTQRAYMLIDREQFEKVSAVFAETSPQTTPVNEFPANIPPGILRSQQAFWRELPELLKKRKWRGQWVCYHGDERVGIAKKGWKLAQQCLDRGIERREFYVAWIGEHETAPWVTTDLEDPRCAATDEDPITMLGNPDEDS